VGAGVNSALDGGEWSASRPGSFTPGERDPGALSTGSWVSPRVRLDAVGRRKLRCPCRKSNPGSPAYSSVSQSRYYSIIIIIIIMTTIILQNNSVLPYVPYFAMGLFLMLM